jgi:hypothetical protein
MRIALRRVPRDRAPQGAPPGGESAAIRTKAGAVAPFVRRWPGLGLGERLPPLGRLSAPADVPSESRIVLRGINLR